MAEVQTSTCSGCSHRGTRECPGPEPSTCNSFLSWSEVWTRETAAIQRAQRITYAMAAVLMVLAVAVLLLPKGLLY